MATIDHEEHVQALAFTAFGSLPHARLLRLRGVTADWLQAVLPAISFGRSRHERSVQLLLTAAGATALGASPAEIASLGREFSLGMTHTASRQRIGDSGSRAPNATWWTDLDHEAALLLYARSREELAALAADLSRGVTVTGQHDIWLPESGREHFGFLDGITRTRIARPGQAETDAFAAGTFVFGLPDPEGATAHGGGLGQFGSLVVLRQLSQYVRAFWKFWLDAAGGDEATSILLASKAIGRWPNGMPLLPGQTHEPPFDREKLDLATFAHDRHGHGCPFGSHIRRANPRDGLVESADVSRRISAQHTILRRGRLFGPGAPTHWYPEPLRPHLPPGDKAAAGEDRGLLFIGLCTDLRRQFEFIMQNWLLAPKFADLFHEVDPLFAHADTPRTLSIQTARFNRRVSDVGGWIHAHGGGYYLLPGRGVLERLVRAAAAWRSNGG